MKKLTLIVALLLVLSGGSAFAETTSTQTQVDSINDLTTQIRALQTERQGKLADLIVQLRQGTRSDAVVTLQTLLSLDASIYPEGLVTGFFGQLTAKAVRNFQARNGLPMVGNVGPRTAEKLKKFAEDNELTVDEDNEDNDHQGEHGRGHKLCAIVPPGHLIAMGWLKRNDGRRPEIPTCQKLPKGIKDRLEGETNPPSNPNDTTAPVISSIMSKDVSNTFARITWHTDEVSKSKVWYGTVNPLVTGSATLKTDNSFVLNHSVNLSSLLPNTTYYFIVGAVDASGNESAGTQASFTTSSTDTVGPVISDLTTSDITTVAAKVTWTTNEGAKDKIWYGTVNPVVTSGAATALNNNLRTSHNFNLSGLSASTTYYYVVSSTDNSGNVTTSSQGSFTTLTPDVTGPVISDLATSDVTSTGAKLSWHTNEGAQDKVWLGTANPVVTSGDPTADNTTLRTDHTFTFTGLTSGTAYFYIVSSKDSSGNVTLSAQGTFTTSI